MINAKGAATVRRWFGRSVALPDDSVLRRSVLKLRHVFRPPISRPRRDLIQMP